MFLDLWLQNMIKYDRKSILLEYVSLIVEYEAKNCHGLKK